MSNEKGTAVKPLTLNDHAEAILKACPAPMHQVCMEICKSGGFQPWHLIVGHLVKQDQRGEIHAPLLLDSWTETSSTPNSGFKKCLCCGRQIVKLAEAHPELTPNYCCNACGSGKYKRNQIHSPDCEFFVKPVQALKMSPEASPLAPIDPEARVKWEESQFNKHLLESQQEEMNGGGLPGVPDLDTNPQREWAGKAQ
jgi:hypothetical protein